MDQFIALHKLSFQVADHLVTSFHPSFLIQRLQLIFPLSILRSIITYALDPYFRDPIINCLKTTPFNLMCDESSDKGQV